MATSSFAMWPVLEQLSLHVVEPLNSFLRQSQLLPPLGSPPEVQVKPTANLRRQHQELAELAIEIERAVGVAQPQQVRRLLGRLAGKLQMHAAMEEKALYPRLMEHERDDVRRIATRLKEEVGGVYTLVSAFVERWSRIGAIEKDETGFSTEADAAFEVLRRRVEIEERELYPVADVIS